MNAPRHGLGRLGRCLEPGMALVAAPSRGAGGGGQQALPGLALDQGAGLGDALHADDVHVGLGAELLELLGAPAGFKA